MDMKKNIVEPFTKVEAMLDQLLTELKAKADQETDNESSRLREDDLEEDEEEEESQSYPRVRQLNEATAYGVLEIDINGKIVFGNRSVHKMFGLGDQKLIGTSIFEQIGSCERRNTLSNALANVSEFQRTPESYFTTLSNDAGSIDLKVDWNFRRDSEARIIGYFCILTDITEQKNSAAALRVSEKRFSQILDIADEAIISIDQSNKITLFNKGAEKIFGRRKADTVGQSLDVLLPEEVHASHHRQVENFSKGSVTSRQMDKRGHLLGRRKDGQLFLAEASISKTQIEGEYVYTAYLRDVSEQEKMRAALQESEAKFRNLVETSQDLIWNLDEKACFTYLNSTWKCVLGYDQEEMLGRPIIDFEEPTTQSNLLFGTDQLSINSQVSNFEVKFITKTGESVNLKFRAKGLFNSEGELVQILGTAYNISKQRKMEVELVRSEKTNTLGKMARSVVHDFNNFLTPILTYSELLLDKLEPNSKEHAYSASIFKSAGWARDLARQILLSSRYDNSEKKIVDLCPLMLEVTEHVRANLPDSITITNTVPGASLPARCSPIRIRQLLLNLITNAEQAISGNGKIEVTLENSRLENFECHFGEKISGEHVRIAVTDDGVGMDEATVRKIFEPFFTTKEAAKGTGLGLATVYSIVQECSGYICVSTSLNRGTTFEIFLPKVAGTVDSEIGDSETGDSETSDSQLVLGNQAERILVVDDQEDITRLWQNYFISLGYIVSVAADGDKALEMIVSNPTKFDVVVTDLTMPVMSGDELALKLQKLKLDIPIILCTGYSGELTKETCRDIGINRLLIKPVKLSLLGQTVREIINQDK